MKKYYSKKGKEFIDPVGLRWRRVNVRDMIKQVIYGVIG